VSLHRPAIPDYDILRRDVSFAPRLVSAALDGVRVVGLVERTPFDKSGIARLQIYSVGIGSAANRIDIPQDYIVADGKMHCPCGRPANLETFETDVFAFREMEELRTRETPFGIEEKVAVPIFDVGF
jgi:hypothetical protein